MFKKFIVNAALVLFSPCLVLGIGEVIFHFMTRPPMQVISGFTQSATAAQKNDFTLQGSPPDSLFQYTPDGGVRLTPNAHIFIKNHELSHRDIEMRINSLGFRSPEVPPEKGDETRVLVLGDSITMGDYVAEEETYPGQLETFLKKKTDVRVINAGIGSADIHNEYQILTESGLATQPDLVVVGLYLNDGELSANLIVRPLPGILGRSYFLNYIYRKARLVWYRMSHRQELAGSNRKWLDQFEREHKVAEKDWTTNPEGFNFLIVKNARDWGAAWDPKTWETIQTFLIKMKDLESSHHFKLSVVFFPVRYQVEAKYLYDVPQQSFESLMSELKIPHLDLLPTLREAWTQDSTLNLYYDKCHLTPLGNEIVAKKIAEFLPLRTIP